MGRKSKYPQDQKADIQADLMFFCHRTETDRQ